MSAIGILYAKAVCRGERKYPGDIPPQYREEVYAYCLINCKEKLDE